ncbi:transmembrane protein 41A-like protein [Dinothrombium tinctorium]|uniref:Transmembrane protein 41A-like protein n=1 Tax=Dinothrombium tinctorium TaxID=1965070 RepID=A0A3S3NYG8_9ACAR|nr:transmembrane protein 41A-like protein [Dinothrombium tinctorium]RWS04337.1 transmembrane protein 41A-like protein [Dinothrombium tinctorium]
MFPNKLSELKIIANRLKTYYETNAAYVFVLFCSVYIFKQTFAIPGSLVMVSIFYLFLSRFALF